MDPSSFRGRFVVGQDTRLLILLLLLPIPGDSTPLLPEGVIHGDTGGALFHVSPHSDLQASAVFVQGKERVVNGVSELESKAGIYEHTVQLHNATLGVEVLTTKVEVKQGLMIRPTIIGSSIDEGPLHLSGDVGFDTGLLLNDGLEVMLVGVGFKASTHGLKVCLVVCFGINF